MRQEATAGGTGVSILSRLRRFLNRQLDPEAWEKGGLSPTNWAILVVILASIVFGVVATEQRVVDALGPWLGRIDHAILILFAAEYAARLASIGLNPKFRGLGGAARYALRPASLADLVVLAPLFMSAPPTWLMVFRLLRIMRLARLAELPRINAAISEFSEAIAAKRFELILTGCSAIMLLLLSATALYLAERHVQPEMFGSIPRALWWAVVTFTTVGYGDVVPQTLLGRIFAGVFAIAGLALVAMLTGVFASALTDAARIHRTRKENHRAAPGSEQRTLESGGGVRD